MENLCGYEGPKIEKSQSESKGGSASKGGSGELITYSPTQAFISNFFTPDSPYKGMLLWHSVGTGKTCSAIATATSTFEPEGYTILWVTRTTLKNDIWKNMFDQVCHERIRYEIKNGLKVPATQDKRMNLLSKSWSIRPMSYKQFSNLVSKQNDFYKKLVKKNGTEDPLRKTLIIIDEAHKLYGGGDLSSIERPDMNALHESLMKSYILSGNDSVRLLLMTATPITQDPLELIKLINLTKLPNKQIPDSFEAFSNKYLDDQGAFTTAGEKEILDDIAGHISYLNREKDARQFSQPIIENILVPMVDDEGMELVNKFDKSHTKAEFEQNLGPMNKSLDALNSDLNDIKKTLNSKQYEVLKDRCNSYVDKKEKNICNKIVKKNINEIIKEDKEVITRIKNDVKLLKDDIKRLNAEKKDKIKNITEGIKNKTPNYERYKNSIYGSIINKCITTFKNTKAIDELIEKHPAIEAINHQIKVNEDSSNELTQRLKDNIVTYEKRLEIMKRLLTSNEYASNEKNIIRLSIKDESDNFNKLKKQGDKEIANARKISKKNIFKLRKTKRNYLLKFKETMKKKLKEKEKTDKKNKIIEEKAKKLDIKQEKLREDINEDLSRNIKHYELKIDDELKKELKVLELKSREKLEKKEIKEREKARKREEKNVNKTHKLKKNARKREEKNVNKTRKLEEKKIDRETKKTRKLQEKKEKKEIKDREKVEKKANKTRKNKKTLV